MLTKPLIAIINLDRAVTPREGEKLQLEFYHEAGGIVRATSARCLSPKLFFQGTLMEGEDEVQ
jgi:hypothetical protein